MFELSGMPAIAVQNKELLADKQFLVCDFKVTFSLLVFPVLCKIDVSS